MDALKKVWNAIKSGLLYFTSTKGTWYYLLYTGAFMVLLQFNNLGARAGIVLDFLFEYGEVFPILFSSVLCYAYYLAVKKDLNKKNCGESIYPALMVAQGTFYTFLGVSIVLYFYDANSDVSRLISGLKLAFSTSVIGLLSSIATKLYLKTELEEKQKDMLQFTYEHPQKVTENEMYLVLDRILQVNYGIKNSFEKYEQSSSRNMDAFLDKLDANNRIYQNSADSILRGLQSNNQMIYKAIQDLSGASKKNIEDSINSITQEMTNHINSSFQMIFKNIESLGYSLNSLQKTNTQATTSAIQMQKTYEKSAELINARTAAIISSLDNMQKSYAAAGNSISNINEGMQTASQKFCNSFTESTDNLYKLTNDINTYFVSVCEVLNNNAKLIDDNLQNLTKSISSYNNTMSSSAEKNIAVAKEMSTAIEQINVVAATITKRVSELKQLEYDISESGKGIASQFDVIGRNLLEKNEAYNDLLIDAQKKYTDNINYAISGVTDVISMAKKEYESQLKELHKEIANIKEASKKE